MLLTSIKIHSCIHIQNLLAEHVNASPYEVVVFLLQRLPNLQRHDIAPNAQLQVKDMEKPLAKSPESGLHHHLLRAS